MTVTWRSLGFVGALVLAGCPGTPTTGDPDAGVDSQTGQGLALTWQAIPAIPGDAGSNVSVSDVSILVRDLRAIGDSAPGDERTSTGALELAWSSSRSPAAIRYPEAPAGIYSHLDLRADGGLFDAVRLHGTARHAGVDYPFELELDGPISVSMPLSLELPPNAGAAIRIDVDLGSVARAVDWDAAVVEEGKLHVEENTSGAAVSAFKVAFSAHPL